MNIDLKINGETVRLDIPPNEILLDTLRTRIGLTGTKDVCRTGDCGACTVLVDGEAVHSCLVLTVEVHGSRILTVEGLAENDKLNPLQQAFIEEDATHCGYCTPGILMAGVALLNENSNPNRSDVEEALKGNLCRCGTYYDAVNAILKASQKIGKSKSKTH